MLTRTAFGLAVVLASVSGSVAAPRAQAVADTRTVYNPFSDDIAGRRSRTESAPTVWGWPYVPPRTTK
jgi:hypothetical protein